MKTEDLIKALTEDRATPGPSFRARVGLAAVVGTAFSLVLLTTSLGIRPDIVAALSDWRFPLKIVFAIVLTATSFVLYTRSAGPEPLRFRSAAILLPVPAVLLIGAAIEMLETSPAKWLTSAAGSHPGLCMLAIPTLAMAPLAGLLLALRHGVPASRTLSGSVAGLLAGSFGAAVYIVRCTDDSPLFVAFWYVAAILVVAFVGATAGRRILA